jgi:archaellum component FlaF (FlaF/FlaG flagellin family)
MEVHKHPHHVTHKKKWTEYLLEFLMLFLAVFLGFTAENIREHNVERHREKEYIRSLLQDLRQDSSQFDIAVTYNSKNLKNIDTSIVLLNSPVITDSMCRMLYYSHKSNPYFRTLLYNQRTITQLKSAGGFRLITNQLVSDSIAYYNDRIEYGAWIREELLAALKDDRASGFFIFNEFLLRDFKKDSAILISANKFPLMSVDKALLIPYANKLKLRYDWLASYNSILKLQQGRCNRLIALIKKEYHLEKEAL